MPYDVLMNKAAIIERTIQRVHEEYHNAGDNFVTDYTRQDAAILNIQRACEAALDMGQYVIAQERLGLAQSARDVYQILADKGKISQDLAQSLQKMVGFRNIAVHDYQQILMPIVEKIITEHLQDFLQLSQVLLQKKIKEDTD